MLPFRFHNPVQVEFGPSAIEALARLVPEGARVLLLAGGGSIRGNGVYDRVVAALGNRLRGEFWGIEPNPRFETLMSAVAQVREGGHDFLVAAGGGSVVDGTKFVAAASPFAGDPWELLSRRAPVEKALPLGVVLTLPATGSEMNGNSVISRESTGEKLHFGTPLVYPRFALLDPSVTLGLPARQTANGVVDAFVHVLEQYATHPGPTLQDRQAEAVLLALLEEGPRALERPGDLETRGNLMWAATCALNGQLGLGRAQDWATHGIGHELTARYGIDHARSLAIVLPGVWEFRLPDKRAKLAQLARRVFGLEGNNEEMLAREAVARTEAFFRALGCPTRLSEHGIDAAEAAAFVRSRFAERGTRLGEGSAIGPDEAARILATRA